MAHMQVDVGGNRTQLVEVRAEAAAAAADVIEILAVAARFAEVQLVQGGPPRITSSEPRSSLVAIWIISRDRIRSCST